VNQLQELKADLKRQIEPLNDKHNDLKKKIAEEREKNESILKTMYQVC